MISAAPANLELKDIVNLSPIYVYIMPAAVTHMVELQSSSFYEIANILSSWRSPINMPQST